MYDSTLDYIYSIAPELGDKVSEYVQSGNGDESTASFVARMEEYEMANNEWWYSTDPNIVAYYQLNEPVLLMNFGTFHGYVEEFLGRGVMTHEFGAGFGVDDLRAEAETKRAELGYF